VVDPPSDLPWSAPRSVLPAILILADADWLRTLARPVETSRMALAHNASPLRTAVRIKACGETRSREAYWPGPLLLLVLRIMAITSLYELERALISMHSASMSGNRRTADTASSVVQDLEFAT
jgi:hypothetical protein